MPHFAAALGRGVGGRDAVLSAVVAPTAFRSLPAEQAGPFVRALFPTFFLVNGAAGLVAAALAFPAFPGALLFLGGAALVALRFVVVPAINAARALRSEPTKAQRRPSPAGIASPLSSMPPRSSYTPGRRGRF